MQQYVSLALGAVVVVLGAVLIFSRPSHVAQAPTQNTNAATVTTNVNTATAGADFVLFSTIDFPDRDPEFSFSLRIPSTWRVEYLPIQRAMNAYSGEAKLSLQESQMFIRLYEGDGNTLPDDSFTSDAPTVIASDKAKVTIRHLKRPDNVLIRPRTDIPRFLVGSYSWVTVLPLPGQDAPSYSMAFPSSVSDALITTIINSFTRIE